MAPPKVPVLRGSLFGERENFLPATKGLSLVKICSQMIKIAMGAMMALHENRKKS